MIVGEPWWLFPELLDAASCNRVIAHGLALHGEEGTTRDGDDGSRRKTSIAWLNEDWVYDLVQDWVSKANRAARWNFQIQRMLPLQFGVYSVGGHYGWHFDDRSGRGLR